MTSAYQSNNMVTRAKKKYNLVGWNHANGLHVSDMT